MPPGRDDKGFAQAGPLLKDSRAVDVAVLDHKVDGPSEPERRPFTNAPRSVQHRVSCGQLGFISFAPPRVCLTHERSNCCEIKKKNAHADFSFWPFGRLLLADVELGVVCGAAARGVAERDTQHGKRVGLTSIKRQ